MIGIFVPYKIQLSKDCFNKMAELSLYRNVILGSDGVVGHPSHTLTSSPWLVSRMALPLSWWLESWQ